ncbi:MAG: formate dehydrogenase accessory sulfurtransferase FdhD, partial [Pseudomonadota bacterium]
MSARAAPADYIVKPDPDDPRLTETVAGVVAAGAAVETRVPMERPLTLYLNRQEIVTMMTIGDRPEDLAVGYLLNQNMLRPDDVIEGIDYDEDLEVVVVRTARETDYEDKLRKKVRTSGCAPGTAFGDMMESFDDIVLDPDAVLRTGWLARLSKA